MSSVSQLCNSFKIHHKDHYSHCYLSRYIKAIIYKETQQLSLLLFLSSRRSDYRSRLRRAKLLAAVQQHCLVAKHPQQRKETLRLVDSNCNHTIHSLQYATSLRANVQQPKPQCCKLHNLFPWQPCWVIWQQLLSSPPLCASVGLVLPVLGPSLAHGCYHNAVHVEPGLTQQCRVGLAQTALQHVEKGLTHLLKKTHNWEKQTIFSQQTDMWNCFFIKVSIWNVGPTANDCVLTPTAWCFLPRLSRKSSKEGRSSRWLTAASITSITCTDTCKYTQRKCFKP